ncbi:hypothetical protein CRG98_028396 [Punica granatum]|uniref:Uncharacterized protein n=1 Tax=Punica granatum TaxID=22663 RepID=A0A2I0J4Q4_PUNGR|nr:hypothetical protein CRG98_028396 [Punica granatum]
MAYGFGPESRQISKCKGSVITNNSKDRFPNEGKTNRDSKEVTDDSAIPLKVDGRILLDPIRVSNNARESHGLKERGAPKASGRPRSLTAPVARRWLWVP